jgi:hypothetical protein
LYGFWPINRLLEVLYDLQGSRISYVAPVSALSLTAIVVFTTDELLHTFQLEFNIVLDLLVPLLQHDERTLCSFLRDTQIQSTKELVNLAVAL